MDRRAAEEYILGRAGSGTYVQFPVPDGVPARAMASVLQTKRSARLSRRGRALARVVMPVTAGSSVPPLPRPVAPGVPAVDEFPVRPWGRLEAEVRRRLPRSHLSELSPAGYPPLREAIAAHLCTARGMRCDAGQVVIVNGSAQALDLAARVLLDPGDVVWVEDPGYRGAIETFRDAGADLVPVPVDREGIDIRRAARRRRARLAYVTPSRQFPLGVTMSLARRLGLLDWAVRSRGWIIEDDYDNEYRYRGRPLTALQGLDSAECVIYVGTFSKVLFPTIRLGYLVAPRSLAAAFVAARARTDRGSPMFDQAVVAEFMTRGQFTRHTRRMRQIYAERQAALLHALGQEAADVVMPGAADGGMHVIGWLADGVNDRAAAARAAEYGVASVPLSRYRLQSRGPGALLLGFAAYPEAEIRLAVRRLAAALRTIPRGGRCRGAKRTRP